MTIESPDFIIHDIRIDPQSILVGATDKDRWDWEMEVDGSGADAATHVWVELTFGTPGHAVCETMGLMTSRGDPLRHRVLATLPALFAAAWHIKDAGWGMQAACAHFRGRPIDLPPHSG